jgi:phosphohistidine phosphatase
MRLYFLRHASAAEIASSDAERVLTKHGESEAHIAGAALLKLGVAPAQILSSPLRRARQTAQIAGAAMKFGGTITTLDELLNHASTTSLLKAVKPWAEAREILLVGHMPSLAEHVNALSNGAGEGGVSLGKAGIACVELDGLRVGTGKLIWLKQQPELARLVG